MIYRIYSHAAKNSNSNSGGFTLIEVIVAMTIIAVSMTLVMQLFSGGLGVSRRSCDYTRAVVHAKGKMEEMALNPKQGSGEFSDGFRWQSELQPYAELNGNIEGEPVNLMKLKVIIEWDDYSNRQKSVDLVSLIIIQEDYE